MASLEESIRDGFDGLGMPHNLDQACSVESPSIFPQLGV
jgi:hypothetical protein